MAGRANATSKRASPAGKRTAKAGLGLFVALGIIAFALWAFAALADGFGEKGRIASVDLTVLSWLQLHGTEQGESIFVFVSWLGAPVLMVVDAAVAIWLATKRKWRLFTLWVVTILGGVCLDEMLKLAFHRARPSVASEFITSHSWSFPSGHAMNSLVGYGMLAILLRQHLVDSRARAAVAIGAVLLIGAIGFSRLYLGVHYLSDVTAGYLAGSVWLLACVTAERFMGVARHRASTAA